MENGKIADAEIVPEPVNEKPFKEQPQGRFIGGEVVIKADPVTGAISVNAPQNMIIALGLLEMAKEILQDNNKRQLQSQNVQPRIVKAGADALKSLGGLKQ